MKTEYFFFRINLFVITFFFSCTNSTLKKTTEFPSDLFFLSEPTMILNEEQDNTIEGNYLLVSEIKDDTVTINLPDDPTFLNSAYGSWLIGWGSEKRYYDSGSQNLKWIKGIIPAEKKIIIGEKVSGKQELKKGDRVVFWNTAPSGFKAHSENPIIDCEWFPEFAGCSMEFGAIVFDSISMQWLMYLQEVDTAQVQIYVACSDDLYNWKAGNEGRPILKAEDFSHRTWAGKNSSGEFAQTAKLYSAIFHNRKWTFFLDGYGADGRRHIGVMTTADPLNGPFEILKNPIISTGENGAWDERACFYSKVSKRGNEFILCYDGVDANGVERVGLAFSNDLLHWKKSQYNPVIDQHSGWRSGAYTSEPNYISANEDTILIMCGGYKKYNTDFSENEAPENFNIHFTDTSTTGLHVSGNVMDAQLGLFISTDGGKSFHPHPNNPIFINDFSSELQNDHMGGNFFYQKNSDKEIIIHQAKSETQKRYNIILRERMAFNSTFLLRTVKRSHPY